jgi:uncharacterized membrane-anchored protein
VAGATTRKPPAAQSMPGKAAHVAEFGLSSTARAGNLPAGAGEAPLRQFQGKSMRSKLAAAVLAALLFAPSTYADEVPADRAAQLAFLRSLNYRSGSVPLSEAGATLKVQEGFRFLDSKDADKVLQSWGNPPSPEVLGMLVPASPGLDDEHAWVVVVTYSSDGHISDEDATKVDYDQVMKDMKAESAEENEARKSEGYDAVNVVGWAQPPHYDAAGKRIYWARELDFEGSERHTLNYDIRVLGREGYLSMNAVADMRDMAMVKDGMQHVLPMATFDAGHAYADFKPGSDKLAGYGLAALVGGGIAAKTGQFAKLGVLLLAGKKFVVAGVIALGALAKKIFGGKDKRGGGTVS